MRTQLTPAGGLLVAAAVHLGFQAVVSVVVCPALREVPADVWSRAHAAHSRRITWVVVPVYALLGTAVLRALVSGPRTAPVLLAVTGAAAAGLSTALVAAPTHGRLGRDGPTPELLARLRGSDGVRLAGAAVAAAAALAAVLAEAERDVAQGR